jgi:A-macroglobulin TED domain/MG2 domain/Carboxypeptidase regulatory-like domain/Alpha-2-macroglobulin family/A-macroglobulin receptor binding domain/Macroglobulin domain MG3
MYAAILARKQREIPMTPQHRRCLFAAASLLLPLHLGAQASGPQLHVDEAKVRFSFPAGHFLAELPIGNTGPVTSAQIAVDLLDTQNTVRSHGNATCPLRTATTLCSVTLPPANPEFESSNDSHDDGRLADLRVRYSVTAPQQPELAGTLALDRIAPALFVLQDAPPRNIQPGGFYSIRIRATHPLTRLPQAGVPLDATVTASIESKDNDPLVVHKHLVTDRNGFATLEFTAPSATDLGSVDVGIEGRLTNLRTILDHNIGVPNQQSLTLTTDKPLYQPGQTVHLRLLAIDHRSHTQANAKITLDVRDPDSTLVFRTEATTSRFGIASADWPIPARLRLGNYRIEARGNDIDEAGAQIRISRYDLPTFTVAPKPDKPFYLPGQSATVEVRANYLFGKPVLHGHVRVVRETGREWNFEKQQYDTKEGAVYAGELNADGSFTAHVNLAADEKQYTDPDNDRSASNDFEDLHLAAYVTDASTGRTEQRRFDLRITAQPLHVYFLRDSDMASGLSTAAYVSVTTADGQPAANASVLIGLLPRESSDPNETLNQRAVHAIELAKVTTNSYGLARLDKLPTYEELVKRTPPPVHVAPNEEDAPDPALLITAHTAAARTGRAVQPIDEPEAILRVTTDHALYKPGDPIRVTVTSAQPSLPIHVQLFRNAHAGPVTLATENVTLHDGRAILTFASGTQDAPDPRFTGYLTVSAVALASGRTVRPPWGGENEIEATASRTVLFPRDNSLHVDVKLARDTYRPGETATAIVNVKGPQDADGDDTSAARTALGLVAVDQAVNERNRSDNDFGNSNSFFFPWPFLFISNHEVAGLTLADIEQRDPAKPFTPDLDLAAAVLLDGNRSGIALEDNAPSQNFPSVFSKILDAQLNPIREALRDYLKTSPDAPTTVSELDELLAAHKLSLSALRDPWGRPYHLVTSPDYTQLALELVSDGSDKQPNTTDDFTLQLIQWNWFARHESELRRVLIDEHQRTGGFIRDLPALTAAMQADHIDFNSWRDPWGQPFMWTFDVIQSDYTVIAKTEGPPPAQGHTHRNSFAAGSASISWFTDDRLRVDNALNAYVAKHPFPTSESELDAALQASGLSLAKLVDPWGHALYAGFRTRSIFTDRVTVEARAHAGETPQKHTTITPVTEIVDTVDLRSLGPDGKRGKQPDSDYIDDFTAASFSHIRSQQSAKETAPQKPSGNTTQSGEHFIDTGAITGTITDITGAVIPNASVLATNTATQAEFESKTDESGQYLLTPLPAGLYTVRIESPGFQRTIIDQVHVLSPDATLLDVKLQLGNVSAMVTVNAEAVSVSTSNATLGSLPLQGRQFNRLEAFAKISSGAAAPPPPPSILGTPRVREYFPETLLWRPEVLTTDDGNASIRFPVADSITSWQLSVAASTLRGNTGAGAAQFQTFLPFFAAFDPPQTLTVGDRLALPITLRNYLNHPVKVRSELTASDASSRQASSPSADKSLSSRPESSQLYREDAAERSQHLPSSTPWLRIDTPPATTTVPAADSASPTARIAVIEPILNGKLRFTAHPEGNAGDSIERPVTVHPNGQETAVTTAGIVNGPTTFDLTIPADALPGGNDATLKLYPNFSAHLRDALVAVAGYPDGCAEQIISTAWPSLLLQRYAGKLPSPDKDLSRETQLNLEAAYANLLSDRDSDGSFRYWSNDKHSDLVLTAYAVQFLTAAKEFVAIDDNVIKSAVAYLATQQTKSGLWITIDRDGKPHPEDADGNAMLTASIAAMLAGAPDADPIIRKALTATQPFADSIDEPYTLANYALAAIAVKDTARSAPAITRLRALALSENGGAYWKLETNTPFFGWGRAGRVESTAATLRALLAAGANPNDDLVTRGMLFLDHQQDRHSLWYSTQATARVLDVLAAIALGNATGMSNSKPGNVTVRIDGQPIATVVLPSADRDAGPLFVPLGPALTPGTHKVTLDMPTGTSAATAQIVANLYRPWPSTAPTSATTNNEQLHLAVSFDNTGATPGAPIHATAHIERLGFRGYGMLIAEIGLPPGADVDRASLETAIADSGYTLNHYEVLPDKLLVYLWPRAGGYDLRFTFSLRYAIDALTSPSVVYDYYNPDARFDLPPQRFTSLH